MTYSWQAAGTVEALHGLIHSVEYRRKYAFWRVVSLIQAFLLQEDLCKLCVSAHPISCPWSSRFPIRCYSDMGTALLILP